MFVDTHAHIYSNEFSADMDDVIQRAVSAGIQKIILPSIDKSHFDAMKQIENVYPQLCISLIGLHPSSAGKEIELELRLVEEELDTHKYHGIGEIGIDLYWDKTFLQQQVYAFERQLRMAVKYNLPVVIHQRESFPQIMDVINRQEFVGLKGIFHCYAGDVKTAESLIKKGFLLGIGGIVTYRNAMMAEVVREIPMEYLVLETDAPYLPPIPFRGKRNEPSYIPIIAEKIAEIKLTTIENVADVTSKNALNLFRLFD